MYVVYSTTVPRVLISHYGHIHNFFFLHLLPEKNYLQARSRISTSVLAICQPFLPLKITALESEIIRFT
jgi:hypothetical protein